MKWDRYMIASGLFMGVAITALLTSIEIQRNTFVAREAMCDQ